MSVLWFTDENGIYITREKDGEVVAVIEPEQVVHLLATCSSWMRDQQINRNRKNFMRSRDANHD